MGNGGVVAYNIVKLLCDFKSRYIHTLVHSDTVSSTSIQVIVKICDEQPRLMWSRRTSLLEKRGLAWMTSSTPRPVWKTHEKVQGTGTIFPLSSLFLIVKND